ncbi:unnamed protein product, partial [marine sediment metagenome]
NMSRSVFSNIQGTNKRVETNGPNGRPNGYLVELDTEGRRTKSYLTVAYPGCFKGYHAHVVREANYVCIRGKVRVVLVTKQGILKHVLETNDTLHIPINIPTGIQNEGEDEAWLINFPNPAYDPELKFEQVDLDTEREALDWVEKS